MSEILSINQEALLVKIVLLVEGAEDGLAIATLSELLELSYAGTMSALYTLFTEGVLTVDSFQTVRLVGLQYSDYFGVCVEVRFCPHCKRFTNQATNEHGDWGCLCCEKVTTKEEVGNGSTGLGN
jgi:hypothetical protein